MLILGGRRPQHRTSISNSGRVAWVTIQPRCGGIPRAQLLCVSVTTLDSRRIYERGNAAAMGSDASLAGVFRGGYWRRRVSVNKHCESVGELVVALGSRTDSSDVAMAVALGHLGLVLLVVGAVVVLAGLVVIALAGRHKQRRCAMDPRRCSTPCLTAAPPCPHSRARGPAVPERHDRARRARPVRLPGHYGAGRYYLRHDHSCRSSSW